MQDLERMDPRPRLGLGQELRNGPGACVILNDGAEQIKHNVSVNICVPTMCKVLRLPFWSHGVKQTNSLEKDQILNNYTISRRRRMSV